MKNKDAMKKSGHGRMLVGEVSLIYFHLDAPDDMNNRRIHHISVQFTSNSVFTLSTREVMEDRSSSGSVPFSGHSHNW